MATTLHEVDPISRIEGHLGVKVTADDAYKYPASTGDPLITEANAHGNLWRGFENFLIGRDVNDAITVTQRICGVCPVPHGMTATYAAESALGINRGMQTFATTSLEDTEADTGVPPKAVLIRNLVLGSEFVMSSITHFYHLAALSYVQGPPIPPWTPFYQDSQYHGLLVSAGHGALAGGTAATGTLRGVLPLNQDGHSKDLWSAVIKQYVKALRIRRLTFEAGGLFAGRMPMTSCYVAGGVTNTARVAQDAKTGPANVASGNDDFEGKIALFYSIFKEIGSFVAREYIPLVLALGVLYPEYDNISNNGQGFGAGCGNYLSWGAFPNVGPSGDPYSGTSGVSHSLAVAGGYKIGASGVVLYNQSSANSESARALVEDFLTEDTARSHYVANTAWGYATNQTKAYPGNITRTEPDRSGGDNYSWMKAPRWQGFPMEVGPLARLVINGKYTSGATIVSQDPYSSYLHPSGGLNACLVHPDLAMALVHQGAASGGLAPLDFHVATTGDPTDYRFTAGNIVDGGAIALVTAIANLKCGMSTMDRLRARALETFWMITWMIGGIDPNEQWNGSMGGWLGQLSTLGATASGYKHYAVPATAGNTGVGANEAPRGALMHCCTTDGAKIVSYQCIVPTTWNGSPKDGPDGAGNVGAWADLPADRIDNNNAAATKRGPIEMAVIGTPFSSTAAYLEYPTASTTPAVSGIEVMRIAQSFDPCIACAVH